MTATKEQLEQLAKIFNFADTGCDADEDDGWKDMAISAELTCDTLAEFRSAADKWAETCPVQEINGGLFWKRVQALKGQPRVAVAVIDCGDFRLCCQR